MRLNEITDNHGATKNRKRIGRGIGSGTGKTGGRGGKGQTARSGVAINGFEGGQMPLHRRLPKRGFTSRSKKDYAIINLDQLQTAIDNGKLDASKAVTTETLISSGLIRRQKDGVRLLGNGELKTKLTLEISGASKSALEVIEKLGGKIEAPAKAHPKAKQTKDRAAAAALETKAEKKAKDVRSKASEAKEPKPKAAKPKKDKTGKTE